MTHLKTANQPRTILSIDSLLDHDTGSDEMNATRFYLAAKIGQASRKA